MVKLAIAAATGLLLILVSCGGSGSVPQISGPAGYGSLLGGGGGSNDLGGRLQPLSNGSSRSLSLVTAEPLPELSGLEPAKPADPEGAIREAAARAATNRSTSATVISVPNTTITTTSPVGGGTSHDYEPKSGLLWVEAQNTLLFTEYHVAGNVNSINLAADGVSYATIGLINWFNYDYSLNQTAPPVSAYMFSQSLYLHIRVVGTDPPGTARVRLCDSNGFFSGTEFITSVPFSYDLKLNPTNPILSTPLVPPYTSHQCGLATLSINSVPLPLPMAYGNDNWGWRIAAGPEQYDLLSGGATVIGQVYSSGDAVTSSINFDADFITGPIATNDPSEWWYYGQNRENSRSSDFTAAHTAGLLWTHTLGGAAIFDSPPVIGGDGTVYTAAQDNKTRAHDPLTGAERWQIATPGVGFLAGPTISETGILYVANSSPPYRLYAVQDTGPAGNMQWQFNVGDPVLAPPIVGYDGTVYVATTTTLYALTDTGPAAVVKWTLPFGSIAPMAISSTGILYTVDPSGVLRAIFDAGVAGNVNWAVGTGNNQVCGPALAPDGTIYAATNGPAGVASLTDNGLSFTVNWAGGLPAPSTNGIAVSSTKVLYMALQDGNLYAIQDLGGSAALNWSFNCGCYWSAPAVASDNVVYISCSNAPNAGRYLALQDNGASFTQLWSFNTGQTIGLGASPTLSETGAVYAATTGPKLFAIHDSATPAPHIDCTALANANFTVYNAVGTPLTGTLDTDVVFDTSSIPLATGDQFYVQFSLDPAQVNDVVLYPARPDRTAGGVVTVNAASLTIPASLVPFFDNPVGTLDLVLRPDAYNRTQNNVVSQAPSQYQLYDAVSAATFTPILLAENSALRFVILAANTEYQVQFSPRPYPLAGSTASSLGSPETIYPTRFASGRFVVGFATLTEAGAVAGPNNDNTDYYTQAALVNTIDPDAYCRFETQASATMLAQYGFRDVTLGTWIVIPSFPFGREPQAKPFDVFSFARGTVFQATDGASFSANITVNPGRTLDATAYPAALTATIGGTSLNLEPLRPRVFDDPGQPDPGQAGAPVSGTGPWNVPLFFGLQYGAFPKTVEVDADYGGSVSDTGTGTPAAWGNGVPGRVYTVSGSPFAADGLIAASVTIPLTQPSGTYTFAIRVTDASGGEYTYVWPNAVTTTGVPPSWHPIVSEATGAAIGGTSLAVVNGNPAIAFWNSTASTVRYIRATAPDGSAWGTPSVLVSGADSTYGTPCLKVINGNPAVAYYRTSPSIDLRYVRATDANGTAWGAPVTVSGAAMGSDVSMAVLPSGVPAIAFTRNGPQTAHVRASDANGTAWQPPNNIEGVAGRFQSLAIVNGRPAVAYQTGSNTLKYCRSSNANGTAWPAPTTLDATTSGWGSSLAVVNGNPAISFHRTGPNTLRFIRATDIDGTAWGAVQVLGACGTGIFNPLAVIGGNPSIAYMTSTNGLGYLPGLDASGTVFGPNQTPDPAPVVGENISLAQISAIGPGISYNVGTNLKFSIYY